MRRPQVQHVLARARQRLAIEEHLLLEPGKVGRADTATIAVTSRHHGAAAATSAWRQGICLTLECRVPGPDGLGRAKHGVASVTLWSEPDKKYAAKLREIAPSADPATRTYLAKFSLPGAGDSVSLGMTATLTLADPATERVAKLPLSALYNQGSSPSLYVVDDAGNIALKPVTVKAYESENVIIAAGVEEGAKVVTLGVQKLDPAQKVRVVSSLSF